MGLKELKNILSDTDMVEFDEEFQFEMADLVEFVHKINSIFEREVPAHLQPVRQFRRSSGRHGYPGDPLIDPEAKFKRASIAALKKYRQAKPFKKAGESFMDWTQRRFLLLKELVTTIAKAEGGRVPELRMENVMPGASSAGGGGLRSSYYSPAGHFITMIGKLSLTTLLHELGHALGYDEYGAVYFSVNLHRKVYKDLWDSGKFYVEPDSHVIRWRG